MSHKQKQRQREREMLRLNLNSQRGAAVLVVIVLVAASALILARNAAFLGLGELELGYTSQKGGEAFAAADGCMEEAFRRMRLDSGYAGGSLNVSNGSCTIVVAGSNPYTIIVAGTTGNYHKKIEAVITLAGNVITVDSWRELAN
jgi:hypothetical protein